MPSPFAALCTAGLLAIFSSTISKSPALPLFAQHLGADAGLVGLVAGASAFTGIVASIPAGLMSDRIGRRRMLAFAGVVFATAPFCYLFITQIWQLVLVRFYHGLATAIFLPVAMAMVADTYSASRGEKLGWFSTATLLGRFMAPIVGGALLGAYALSAGEGFHAVYIACGAAGVVALILILRLPEPERSTKQKFTSQDIAQALRLVLTDRLILATCATEAAVLFAYGAFETFLPLYARELGMSAYAIGALLSIQIITLALTKPAMGRFSDRHGRRGQIAWGAALCAASIGAIYFLQAFWALLCASVAFGLGLSVVTSATSAFIGDLSKRDTRGTAMGALGSIMDIGHTTGPIVAGAVGVAYGLSISFVAAAGVLLAMGGVFVIVSSAGKELNRT